MNFANSLFVYKADDATLTDLQLLALTGTSVQTQRTRTELYFATYDEISGSGFNKVRDPIPEPVIEANSNVVITTDTITEGNV